MPICKKTSKRTGLSALLFLTISVSACSPAAVVVTPTTVLPAATITQASTLTAAIKPTETLSATGTQPAPSIIPPVTPTAAPPAANRPNPEDWQNWPVIPVVSERAKQIYQAGLASGTDPNRFSKVGDCQAIKDVLLGPFDKPGTFTLRENADALYETIEHFSGSFNRDGEAVQGGFNAASELTPLMSNPDVCDPGETPLECEIRVHNPSILLISLEVWWNGRSPDVYEKNMRQIIEFAIGKGILPILSTKADNVEGDHSINLATTRLAYDYDLPLWNWWKAAQALPNRGLDPNRPDGFHISQEFAWPERSFTALQSLDAVWRGVRMESTAAAAQPTALATPATGAFDLIQPEQVTAEPTTTAMQQGDPTAAAVDTGGSLLSPVDQTVLGNPAGLILLSTARRGGEAITPLGIFLIDPTSGTTYRVGAEGLVLQAVSPDGKHLLASRGSDLLVASLDGSQPVTLTNRFYTRVSPAAMWMPDGKSVVFIAEQDGGTLLVHYQLEGSAGWKRLSPAGMSPVAVYQSQETGSVFWQNGACQTGGTCIGKGLYVSGLDGSSAEIHPNAVKAEFSPDKRWLAYEVQTTEDKSQLNLAKLNMANPRPLENIGDILLDFSWSPDGLKLSLLTLERSDYSGQWLDVRNLVITPQDMGTKILPATSGMNPRAVWSADSSSLLLTGTQKTADGYAIQAQVMDVVSGAVRNLSDQTGFTSQDFIYTTRIEWVKPVR